MIFLYSQPSFDLIALPLLPPVCLGLQVCALTCCSLSPACPVSPESCYAAQTGLELMTHLPQPPEYWDYSFTLLCLALLYD